MTSAVEEQVQEQHCSTRNNDIDNDVTDTSHTASKPRTHVRTVADLFVECLVNEGVKTMYGIPGEENIPLMEAIARDGRIRFILTRHEQGAGFMAATQAHLTGRPGVCLATLGPGALNLTLPVAQANASTVPLVAICAQGNVTRLYKESHQIVDLVSVFRPLTQWTSMVVEPASVPEMVRKAFSIAQRNRPGATCLILPEDVAEMPAPEDAHPLPLPDPMDFAPTEDTIVRAVDIIRSAKHPIILAGNGVARGHAENRLLELAEQLNVPVATTFEGKGVISDRIPLALGVVGFMRHDYENFAFDEADLIIAVGFSIQQFDPKKINPNDDKTIIHINTFIEDTDAHYSTALNIMGNIDATLKALIAALREHRITFGVSHPKIHELLTDEYDAYLHDDSFPMKPQRIVADTRRAMETDTDIALVDTGALKMWMARLYPTYYSNTCVIDNSLSTMAWTLPGAVSASLEHPGRPVLAVMGDGSFMMNVQEIETAVRVGARIVILVWVDEAYGLIKWKMDIHDGAHEYVDFNNPDVVALGMSFGAKGHLIESADELYPVLRAALRSGSGIDIIACPVDYSENMKLIDKLGEVDFSG
ncbi:acetolactate synthase large subunit [Bifidobacterium callitrichos]|uniref:Acetolactate synthase large subunit n=1 Tax=Bifidobacterium callitrichos TaxID=762209 RepID=A0A2T3GD81_9BIFI|nr:acetolactate synthase large subunit [Bifidobacterium callitrichos]PST47438.1 acetolactate synthase large subunit [Bifidobacterium callitrichos]